MIGQDNWGCAPPPRSLGVWSRSEEVRVNFKDRRILGQGVTDHLIGRSPSQGIEMLGKIISGDEGQDMGLEAFEIVV